MCNEKPEPFRERVLLGLTTPPTSDERKNNKKQKDKEGSPGGSFATHRDEDALDPELQVALNQSLTTFKEEQVWSLTHNCILFAV